MSIFDIFRPATPTPAPAPLAAPGNNSPGLPGTHSSPTTPPNGTVPTQPPATEPASPLDSFKDVWSNTNTPEAPEALFGKLDPNKLMESARQVDFAKVIKPEQLTAISQGGDGAVQAFATALNSVAQTVYGQSTLATTKIVEEALKRNSESYDTKMQEMVRKFSVNEGLQTSNPLLSNPAVQPLVSALTDQLARKYPNASSAEIQSQVNGYFQQLGTAFAPAPTTPKSQSVKPAEDWASFMQ